MSPLRRSRTPLAAPSSICSAVARSVRVSSRPQMGMSGPRSADHLRVLRESGLVEAELHETTTRGYGCTACVPSHWFALQAWLDQVEAFWSEQLGSFEAHAERTRKKPR